MIGSVECQSAPLFLSENTKIVYTSGNSSAQKAANNLVNFFQTNGIKGIEAVSTADSASASSYIFVTSMEGENCSVEVTDGSLTFKGDSAQLVKLVEFYISLGYFETYTYTFSCTAEDLGYGFNDGIISTVNNTYSYVWGDEFNLNSLDSSRWNYTTADTKMFGYSDNKISAREDYISRQNSDDTDGYLRLTAKANGDGTFTSPASFSTYNKMAYTYGYAEIRARLPYTKGAWPSFWGVSGQPLGTRNTTSYGTEIDVFEVYGDEPDIEAALHKWYTIQENKCSGCGGTEKGYIGGLIGKCDEYPCHESKLIGAGDASALDTSVWHTYGFEWTPNSISMYVDGVCYATYNTSTDLDSSEGNKNMNGFADPICIIFNNHALSPATCQGIGMSRGAITEEIMNTFVANYDIDYFRLYQNDSVQGTALYTK